jgi:hypothetical protein
MKPGVKTVICGVWLGIVILVSVYCGGYFSQLLNFLKEKIIRAEIPPAVDFATTIIPWNIFISLLVCIPLLFIKKRRANAATVIGDEVIFFFLLLAWNLIGVLHLWIFFSESIGSYSGAPSISAIEPFARDEGWSPVQLWCAWWGFIILSNATSAMVVFGIRRGRESHPSKSVLWS